MTEKKKVVDLSGAVLLVLALTLACLIAFVYLAQHLTTDMLPVTTIAALAVLGMAGFAILLFGVAVAFRIMGALDPKQAFGLPRGTVRSVLALGLLIAFIAGSFYWVDRAATQGPLQITRHTLETDTTADLEEIQKALGSEIKVFWTTKTVPGENGKQEKDVRTLNFVDRRTNQEWLDLIQQIITVLSTALAAVVGFYFGSRSTDTSHVGAEDAGAEAERQNQAGQASAQVEAARELLTAITTDVQRAQKAADKVASAHAEAEQSGADEMNTMLLASQLENAKKAYVSAHELEKKARALLDEIEEAAKKLSEKATPPEQAVTYREAIAKALKTLKQQSILAHAAGDRAQKLAGWSSPEARQPENAETPQRQDT